MEFFWVLSLLIAATISGVSSWVIVGRSKRRKGKLFLLLPPLFMVLGSVLQSLFSSAALNSNLGDGVVGSMIEMLAIAPGIWLACFVGSVIGVLLARRQKATAA